MQRNYEMMKEVYDKQVSDFRDKIDDLERVISKLEEQKYEIEKEFEKASERYRIEKDEMI